MPEASIEARRQGVGQQELGARSTGGGRGEKPSADSREIQVRTIRPPSAGNLTSLGNTFRGPGQNGTSELVIPLEVTSARGLEPELTLRCDTVSGNGVFGSGANVALSSVARMNILHLPTYDGADAFALDGAELVPVPGLQQRRTAGGRQFTVTYFRPRREDAFSRIERWEPGDGSVSFWRILSRDDEIAVYGATAAARIFDPDDPTRVFEWLIEARYDARGNAIRYRYKPEDDVGVSLSPAEQGRRHGANRYPQRISYGNLEPFRPVDPLDLPDSPWLFDVLFDYG
jgi:insecticidal toxin complex protein TccC